MRDITRVMVKNFQLKKKGYDFMGYTFTNPEQLSFHHLIIPRRDCKEKGLGDGYVYWNGAILRQDTSHDYLHIIERTDRDVFLAITAQMVEENLKGKVDIENLKRIRELLLYFEKHYENETFSNGKILIKKKFITDRIEL